MTTKAVNTEKFKLTKVTNELVNLTLEKIQKYLKGKGLNHWIDYTLFEKNIKPITCKQFKKQYKNTFFCNAKDTDIISKVLLVYSAYDGILSLIPNSSDGDNFESYINLTEFDIFEVETKVYNKEIIKFFKSVK